MKLKSGYTYIEMLVAFLIIGVLAGFGIMVYPGAQMSARDDQRRSDLKQYQTALENFANRNGSYYPSRNTSNYPASDIYTTPNLCATDLGLVQCPADPRWGQTKCAGTLTCNYYYRSNGIPSGSVSATRYVLYTRLEHKVDGHYAIWVVCSNGLSGTVSTSWSPSNNCPL